MTTVHTDGDAIAEKSDDTRLGNMRDEIAGSAGLIYVAWSCHWSLFLHGGQGLSSATNRRQARSRTKLIFACIPLRVNNIQPPDFWGGVAPVQIMRSVNVTI